MDIPWFFESVVRSFLCSKKEEFNLIQNSPGTGCFFFEIFHFFLLSLSYSTQGRLIWILICWHYLTAAACGIRVKELKMLYRINISICNMLKVECGAVRLWEQPLHWQGNLAVIAKAISIIGLICQWEVSYQPLSFIQWPWWLPVWGTEPQKEADEMRLEDAARSVIAESSRWGSTFYCVTHWLNQTCSAELESVSFPLDLCWLAASHPHA